MENKTTTHQQAEQILQACGWYDRAAAALVRLVESQREREAKTEKAA